MSSTTSSDDESGDVLEEPQLKYERMGSDLLEILKTDAASCVALHCKFVALGTHWGKMHILDHQGNNITSKRFSPHTTTVTSIALDDTGEYVASCSDDGLVSVISLYNDDYSQVITLDKPAKSVALEPGYAQSSSKQIVFGTDKLVMCVRTWLRRHQQTVLHQGEGLVRTIKWRKQFIAWANDWGVKIYDTKQERRITHISRTSTNKRNNTVRPELYPAHISWKDDKTILIGWGNDIKVCAVREKTTQNLREPTKYCVILYQFKADFACCGIAPLGDQIIALAFLEEDLQNETADDHNEPSQRPQLRIIEPDPNNKESYIEVSRDALSIRGYQNYRCSDYSLEYNGSEIFVVSPKDVVLAQKRDEDDRITWLLQINQHREALELVQQYGKRLKKHTYLEVGLTYLSHLMDDGDFAEAAEICPQVLGNNMNLWEQIVYRFSEVGQLREISPLLPRGDFRLPLSCYEMVLEDFLKQDHKGFSKLLNEWPSELYNITTMTNRVLSYLDRDAHNPILLAALAKLYTADNRFDRALSIYLRLQDPEAFQLIRKHNLYKALQENILPLMQFREQQQEAVDLLLDNMEYVPVDRVVAELEEKKNHLHKYLHALFLRDPHLGSEYHALQVRLYAEFDRSRLLPFLRSSNYIPLEEALCICEEREYVDEQVFLLGRMGNASRALALITEHETDVSRAVEFCKDQDDSQLWDELINNSLDKPDYIRGLLENIGTHVDPIILIKKIPNNMKIPGLRDALVKILQDYSMQTALWWECKRILSSDVVALMRKQMNVNMRPQRIDESRDCDACGQPLLCKRAGTRLDFPVVVSFLCQHSFHDKCLSSRDCCVCKGKMRHS
ncbi:vacuolar protein sorting-associated protein 41 homolog isoform X1 [Clavelina lepadiformis]|uniref:vacuolar protein sorting-associated protein 41 homolog isoform X1 n=1 Tax=Clavelina lepadiformis TaxID=159417 RepID=UPI0040428362